MYHCRWRLIIAFITAAVNETGAVSNMDQEPIVHSETPVLQETPGPVSVPIPDGMKSGTILEIVLTAPGNFFIDLKVQSGDNASSATDIALHFIARNELQLGVCSEFKRNIWSPERQQRFQAKGVMKDKYHVKIISYNDEFNVFSDGEHMITCPCSVPIERVNLLQIGGEGVKVCGVLINDAKQNAGSKECDSGFGDGADTGQCTNTPFVFEIPGEQLPLCDGSLIVINGVADGDYSVALQTTPNEHITPDIAYLMIARLSDEAGVAVSNAFIRSVWGAELQQDFPNHHINFLGFRLQIVITEEEYQVYMSGKRVTNFSHRMSTAALTHIVVRGQAWIDDVTVTRSLQEQQETSPPPP